MKFEKSIFRHAKFHNHTSPLPSVRKLVEDLLHQKKKQTKEEELQYRKMETQHGREENESPGQKLCRARETGGKTGVGEWRTSGGKGTDRKPDAFDRMENGV